MIVQEQDSNARTITRHDSDYLIGRLVNYTKAAEGPILPNRLQGGDERVYAAQRFTVARTELLPAGGTRFTLTWAAPQEQQTDYLSHYNIYMLNEVGGVVQPRLVTSARQAPAVLDYEKVEFTTLTFLIQTVLKNGQVSDIFSSPTCIGQTFGYANSTTNIQLPVQVAATTTETTVYTRTFDGATIGAANNWHLLLRGRYSNTNGVDTFTVRAKINGSTIYSATSVAGIVSDVPFYLDWWGTVIGLGASASQTSFLTTTLNATITNQTPTGNTSLDTLQPVTFAITVEWDANTAGNDLFASLGQITLT